MIIHNYATLGIYRSQHCMSRFPEGPIPIVRQPPARYCKKEEPAHILMVIGRRALSEMDKCSICCLNFLFIFSLTPHGGQEVGSKVTGLHTAQVTNLEDITSFARGRPRQH